MAAGDERVAQRRRKIEPWLARVLAISVLSTLSMNAVRPMVAYRALDLGATPFEIGLIAASFSILSVGMALPIGRLVDRFGAGRFEVVAMTIMAVTNLAFIWSDSLIALAAVYTVMGLGQTINLVSQQTTVANRGGRAGRDERFGLYTQASSIGQLLGPTLAGALAGGAVFNALGVDPQLSNVQSPVFLMAAACTATAACIAIPLARSHGQGSPSRDATTEPPGNFASTARRVLLRPGMMQAMLVSIAVVTSIDVLVAYLPVYGEANGLSVGLVGMLLSIRAGASLISRFLMGHSLRLLGRQRLLAGGLILAGAGMLLLAAAPASWLLVAAMAMFGLGAGIGQPITIGWVADQSPRSERATAIGLRLMGNRLALLTMPLAMGLIAGAAGVSVTFAAVAAVLTAGAATAASTPFGAVVRTGDPDAVDTPK